MKKSLWTCHDLLRITKGKLEFSDGLSKNDWYVTGVSIDTRTLKPGDLFIALKDTCLLLRMFLHLQYQKLVQKYGKVLFFSFFCEYHSALSQSPLSVKLAPLASAQL